MLLVASRKNLVELCPGERQRGATRNFAWLQLRRRVRPNPITFLAELQEGAKVFQEGVLQRVSRLSARAA